MQNKPRPYFPTKSVRLPMVKWFSPGILIKTLMNIVNSRILGSQVDTRELQWMPEIASAQGGVVEGQLKVPTGDEVASYVDHPRDENGDFYFDFIADTGDGWDSTYSVASLLSRDKLNVSVDQQKLTLPRGAFVMVGGDLVYPSPSNTAYRNRLVRPFDFACQWRWTCGPSDEDCSGERQMGGLLEPENEPKFYALPGNHDWYDSLSAFRNRFCNIFRPRRLGFWRTHQSRSYFAIELPHNWHVFALDLGNIDYSLDNLQYNYFLDKILNLKSHARIILVTSEPDWYNGGVHRVALYQRLASFEKMIAERFSNSPEKPRVYLNLSGDTHNYQRFERIEVDAIETELEEVLKAEKYAELDKDAIMENVRHDYYQRQKIVSGGGGAFLHPTHVRSRGYANVVPNDTQVRGREYSAKIADVPVDEQYQEKACYPDPDTSRRMALKNALLFMPRNIWLTLFIAAVYLILAWPIRNFLDAVFIEGAAADFSDSGLNFRTIAIAAGVITIYTLWALSRPKFWLGVAGFLHGLLHVALIFGGYAAIYVWLVSTWAPGLMSQSWYLFPIVLDLLFFVLAGIFASTLLGWALWFYLTVFKAGEDDLFGSASIATHKNFLRIKIDSNGNLTVYPIGIPKPVTYSQPKRDEIDDATWQRLCAANGEDWLTHASYSADTKQALQPEAIDYFLIEKPVKITPLVARA